MVWARRHTDVCGLGSDPRSLASCRIRREMSCSALSGMGRQGGYDVAMRWVVFILASSLLMASAATAAEIGVGGKEFLIDGRPKFLLGCSYYSGIGASDEILKNDLGELRNYGFNWIRVWATWVSYGKDVSAVDARSGKIRPQQFARLKKLIEECDRRGMVVNVTLTRGQRLTSFEAHRTAVEELTSGLKEKRNWYLDLGNERNVKDARFVSFEELNRLRDAAKKIDAKRLITASHAGGDLSKADLEKYLKVAEVDFVSVHRPREAGSAAQTQGKTRELLKWMSEMGRVAPLNFDEPFRRGYGDWEPELEDYLRDLKGAKDGGAAGWCFHNGGEKNGPARSFDLSEKGLMEQLDHVERDFLRELRNQNPEFRR